MNRSSSPTILRPITRSGDEAVRQMVDVSNARQDAEGPEASSQLRQGRPIPQEPLKGFHGDGGQHALIPGKSFPGNDRLDMSPSQEYHWRPSMSVQTAAIDRALVVLLDVEERLGHPQPRTIQDEYLGQGIAQLSILLDRSVLADNLPAVYIYSTEEECCYAC